MIMDEEDDLPEFDWSPKGREYWAGHKGFARASELQLRFACSYRRTSNATKSAGEAGSKSSLENKKQSGYRLLHSEGVKVLLALAASDDGQAGEICDLAELQRIFSKLARFGTGPDQVRAGVELVKLKELALAEQARTEKKSPQQLVDGMARIIGSDLARQVALRVAQKHDVAAVIEPGQPPDDEEPDTEAAA